MKKKIVIILIIIGLWIIPRNILATSDSTIENVQEMLDVSSFISEAKEYTENIFDDIEYSELLNSAIEGKIDNSKFINKILSAFGVELKDQISMIISIIIIIVIHSILKSISDGLENDEVSKVSYFIQYILIVGLIMKNFSELIVSIKYSIESLQGFSYSLIPLLMTLMMFTGKIVSVSTIQPILLALITFIGTAISNFLLPLVLIGTSLGIISKISDRIQIDNLAKMFKSSTVWILGIVLTVFTGVLSLESTLTGHIDSLTTKTTKTIVSSAIPVVGKILSDTTEVVLGSGIILKNAIGFVGVIVIIGICASPIIKLSILSLSYKILSACCQPIADKKIIDILEQMKDTFKIMLAMVSSISIMLIIGITIVIKISNV